MSTASKGRRLHFRALITSAQKPQSPSLTLGGPLNTAASQNSCPSLTIEIKPPKPTAATRLLSRRSPRKIAQELHQQRRMAASNAAANIVPTRYSPPLRVDTHIRDNIKPTRFPKLTVITPPPLTYNAVETSLGNFQTSDSTPRVTTVARPQSSPMNLPRLLTNKSCDEQSPQHRQQRKHRSHRWPPNSIAEPPYPSPLHRRIHATSPRAPGSLCAADIRMAPMVRQPRPAAPLPPPAPYGLHTRMRRQAIPRTLQTPSGLCQSLSFWHPSVGAMPSTSLASPLHWHQNVSMLQIQLQQQQHQLLMQQQQIAMMQMQQRTAESGFHMSVSDNIPGFVPPFEPITTRDYVFRNQRLPVISSLSLAAHHMVEQNGSPSKRSGKSPCVKGKSPQAKSRLTPRNKTGAPMRVVLTIENVQLERAIKCALIVRLAPGGKPHTRENSVDYQPQKTEVTCLATNNPQFNRSTFCFRLPDTSSTTTCKFVLRLFRIDMRTNERSVVGIGTLPIDDVAAVLRKGIVYHETTQLKLQSGEVVGNVDLSINSRV